MPYHSLDLALKLFAVSLISGAISYLAVGTSNFVVILFASILSLVLFSKAITSEMRNMIELSD